MLGWSFQTCTVEAAFRCAALLWFSQSEGQGENLGGASRRAVPFAMHGAVPCHSPCTVLPSHPGAAPPPLPPCRRPGDSRGDDVPGDGGDGVYVAGARLLRSCLDAQGHRASCAVGWVRCGGTLGRAGRFPCCPSLLCMLPLAARASAAQGRCAPHLSFAPALLQPPRWP